MNNLTQALETTVASLEAVVPTIEKLEEMPIKAVEAAEAVVEAAKQIIQDKVESIPELVPEEAASAILDSNQDGRITPKDASKTFNDLDGNNDGKVSKAEMGVLLKQLNPAFTILCEKEAMEDPKTFLNNLLAIEPTKQKAYFDILDGNTDGFLSRPEFFQPYKNMDKSKKKDSKITPEEINLWMNEKKYVICWSKREAILEKINKEEEAKEEPVIVEPVIVPPQPTEQVSLVKAPVQIAPIEPVMMETIEMPTAPVQTNYGVHIAIGCTVLAAVLLLVWLFCKYKQRMNIKETQEMPNQVVATPAGLPARNVDDEENKKSEVVADNL